MNEFERKAWESRASSEQHPPKRACDAAADQIERGELGNIIHAIVILVEDTGQGHLIHTLQAGSFSQFASEGAMARALKVSQEGCNCDG